MVMEFRTGSISNRSRTGVSASGSSALPLEKQVQRAQLLLLTDLMDQAEQLFVWCSTKMGGAGTAQEASAAAAASS